MQRFDQEAAQWDQEQRRVKLAEEIATAITEELAPAPQEDALDFGCGTGLLTLALLPRLGSITGADASAGMLREFEAKIQARNISNARAIQLDARDCRLPAAAFDLAVSSMTFHHVEKIEPALAQLFAALRPGGRIGIADLDSDGGKFHAPHMEDVYHNGFDRAALARKFEEAGFVNVKARQAAVVMKPVDGVPQPFTVFLMTGHKPPK